MSNNNNEGVKDIINLLSGMNKHRHFIQDDFQRHGFENFESGIRLACEKLGVKLWMNNIRWVKITIRNVWNEYIKHINY